MGAGILPVALYRGTLFLLLGQERHNHLWCDFGGSPNKGESPFKTAIREGSEELNGFLGSDEDLELTVNCNLVLSICYQKYTTYVFRTKYNKELPYYFSNVNEFAEQFCKDKIDDKHNGLFEKKTIKWFPISQFKNKKNNSLLRGHYVELVNQMVKKEKFIISEIEKLSNIEYAPNIIESQISLS